MPTEGNGHNLERIVAGRITRHLETTEPDPCAEQFGFRRGHFTIDALRRVRDIATTATDLGGRALAISLDIANAFNTLPWGAIHRVLRHHGIPVYLRKVVVAYLKDRSVTCRTSDGTLRRQIKCGSRRGRFSGHSCGT